MIMFFMQRLKRTFSRSTRMFNDPDMVPLAVGNKLIEASGGKLVKDIQKLSCVSEEKIPSLK